MNFRVLDQAAQNHVVNPPHDDFVSACLSGDLNLEPPQTTEVQLLIEAVNNADQGSINGLVNRQS